MTAEKFIVAWVKYLLSPKRLYFKATNLYYEVYKEDIENLQFKDIRKNKKVIKNKKIKNKIRTRKEKIGENIIKDI